MVELPGARLCMSAGSVVRVLDKELHELRTLEHRGWGLAVGSDRLIASDFCTGSLRSYQLDDFSVLVERNYRTFASSLYSLALAPGNLLFALGYRVIGGGWRVFAIDSLTLTHRRTFGNFDQPLSGLAVVGDELFVGGEEGIHVFSSAGAPLRVMRGDLGEPRCLRFMNERLYVIVVSEDVKAEQKIHVLTPEGETLQVYDCAPHLREGKGLQSIGYFDGKLLVVGWRGSNEADLFALRGL